MLLGHPISRGRCGKPRRQNGPAISARPDRTFWPDASAGAWTKADQDSRITGFTTIPRSTSATALLISSNR